MKKVTFSFQTLLLPPPFAYAYVINLEFTVNSLIVNYDLEYLNRDTLDENEILEEGFTLNDDISYRATLPAVWKHLLESSIKEQKLTVDYEEQHEYFLHMEADGTSGYIHDQDFDYLLQELIQAVYESNKKERPLFIQMTQNDHHFSLIGRFETREFLMSQDENEVKINWNILRLFLESLENLDFSEKRLKIPSGENAFITYDNQSFYRIKSYFELKKPEDIFQKLFQTASQSPQDEQ